MVETDESKHGNIQWKSKILEQSGKPLLMSFMKSFPIMKGCIKGVNCVMCKNNGVGCAVKGAVYSASCEQCEEEFTKSPNKLGNLNLNLVKNYIYI